MGLICFFIFPPLLFSLYQGSPAYLFSDFAYNFKLLLFPLSFLFFYSLRIEEPRKKTILRNFTALNFTLIVCNILLGILGIGYSQYSSADASIGGRGFFYAGNEVAGIFVLFSAFAWYFIAKRPGWIKFVTFLFLLSIAVLNSSKTSILGILMVVGLYEISFSINPRISFFQLIKGLLLPIFIIAIPIVIYFGVKSTGLLERMAFFYERMDILTFILSGRNLMVEAATKFFFTEYSFLEYLFGAGQQGFLNLMNIYNGSPHFIEIDFFDVLFMNGFFGVIVVFGFFGFVLVRSFLLKRGSPYDMIFIVNIVLLLVSFLAGHIFNSGMLGISLGLFNGLSLSTASKTIK